MFILPGGMGWQAGRADQLGRARTRRQGHRVATLARPQPPRFGDPKEAALGEATRIDIRVRPLRQADERNLPRQGGFPGAGTAGIYIYMT